MERRDVRGEGNVMVPQEDYKYRVEASCENIYHDEALSVRSGEVVTVRNICPAHQNCEFIEVINQFSESGYIQKRLLQWAGQQDSSYCFISSSCKEPFSCPKGFEEHLCMVHFYNDLKQHITKRGKRGFYCPERGCLLQYDDLNDVILHYGLEHHRVESLAFNHLRRTDVHREHRQDYSILQQRVQTLIEQVDDGKKMENEITRLKKKVELQTELLKVKEEQLKEFYYYNLTKKNEELAKKLKNTAEK